MSKNELLNRPINYEVNGEEVKLTGNMVKEYLVSGNGDVTDQEVVMFLNLCKYQKLNPFLNEAYLVKFGGKPAQIIVSKEAFMKRAESHSEYDGFIAGIIVERDGDLLDLEGAIKLKSDKLIGGWAEIYRKDRKIPVSVKLSYEEFSKGQATWKSMPMNMIRKTAIVNAMREAFPESVGAMYTEEEELPSNPRPIQADIEEEIKENANKEVVDFKEVEEPEELKNEAPINYEEVQNAKRRNVDADEQQEKLFDNIDDTASGPSF